MFVIVGALSIGILLGLMGSGGSILTVPVLRYLLGHESHAAIAESLAIVGAISIVSAIPYARSRELDWFSVLVFAAPGMGGTFLGGHLARFATGEWLLAIFGAVMLAAAIAMFRKGDDDPLSTRARQAVWKIAVAGFGVGVLTGLVGVGGGFLIVPALVVLGGLPMRTAVGTSLTVIVLNSGAAFVKHLDVIARMGVSIDWRTIAVFIAIGGAGSVAGNYISARIQQRTLRRVFAVFVLLMGVFILSQELPKVAGM